MRCQQQGVSTCYCTCNLSPSRDGAGVVGMEETGCPGNADRADRRVVLQTLVWEWKFDQLHQGDVILMSVGVVPLFESVGDSDIIESWLVPLWFHCLHGYRFAAVMLCNIYFDNEGLVPNICCDKCCKSPFCHTRQTQTGMSLFPFVLWVMRSEQYVIHYFKRNTASNFSVCWRHFTLLIWCSHSLMYLIYLEFDSFAIYKNWQKSILTPHSFTTSRAAPPSLPLTVDPNDIFCCWIEIQLRFSLSSA